MRVLFLCFAPLLLSGPLAYGQTDSTLRKEGPKSKVYVYRLSRHIGAATRIKILCDNQPVVNLKNGSYYFFETESGVHTITGKMNSESSVKLDMQPGKSYYIKCHVEPGIMVNYAVVQLVDSVTGGSIVNGGDLRQQLYEPVYNIRHKSRVSFSMGWGGGFATIPMGTDNNGNEITLSTGGGFSMGLQYGYEVSPHFDLSVDWFYQMSPLSDHVNNFDAYYERMGVTITPAVVIPVIDKEMFLLKLGAGPGVYSLGTLSVNASKAGIGDFKLKYNTALGFHASVILDCLLTERSSLFVGLKYYNVHYKYTTSGSTGSSTDNRVNNPDGSGIDCLFGYTYHF